MHEFMIDELQHTAMAGGFPTMRQVPVEVRPGKICFIDLVVYAADRPTAIEIERRNTARSVNDVAKAKAIHAHVWIVVQHANLVRPVRNTLRRSGIDVSDPSICVLTFGQAKARILQL